MSEFSFHTSFITERNPHDTGRTQQGTRRFLHCVWSDASKRPCAAHSGSGFGTGRSDWQWRRTHCCQADQRLLGCAGADAPANHSLTNDEDDISGGLFRRAVGAAQVGPINVWPQFFAADGAFRLALDTNRQRFPAGFAVCDVRQMAPGRFTSPRELIALYRRKPHEICFELFHGANNTPSGVINQHRLVNFHIDNHLV